VQSDGSDSDSDKFNESIEQRIQQQLLAHSKAIDG
jgi:hypothetical protein